MKPIFILLGVCIAVYIFCLVENKNKKESFRSSQHSRIADLTENEGFGVGEGTVGFGRFGSSFMA